MPTYAYNYPFTIPTGVALSCRSPNDGLFYCQYPGCGDYHASYNTAKRHLRREHTKAKVRSMGRSSRRRRRRRRVAGVVATATAVAPVGQAVALLLQ